MRWSSLFPSWDSVPLIWAKILAALERERRVAAVPAFAVPACSHLGRRRAALGSIRGPADVVAACRHPPYSLIPSCSLQNENQDASYSGSVSIGTPAQTFDLILDTGQFPPLLTSHPIPRPCPHPSSAPPRPRFPAVTD